MAESSVHSEKGAGGPEGPPDSDSESPAGRFLRRVTEGVTLLGGGLLLAIMTLTVVSVIGRYAFNSPIEGDYELVEMGGAVAIFLCFPFTTFNGSNIVAEFFTVGLSDRNKLILDTIHDAIFAAVAALLTWRMSIGAMSKYEEHDTSMLLQVPVWYAFSLAVLAMAMLTIVCCWRVRNDLRRLRSR